VNTRHRTGPRAALEQQTGVRVAVNRADHCRGPQTFTYIIGLFASRLHQSRMPSDEHHSVALQS